MARGAVIAAAPPGSRPAKNWLAFSGLDANSAGTNDMNRLLTSILAACLIVAAAWQCLQAQGGRIDLVPERDQTLRGGTRADDTIEDLSLRLTVRPYLLVPLKSMVLQHFGDLKHTTTKPAGFNANNSLNAGLGLSWWIFGLAFHLAVPGAHGDEKTNGKTSSLDIQFNYYFRKVGFDLYYQRYKGFALSNPRQFGYLPRYFPAIRPDLSLFTVGGNIFYVFSDRFSFDAAFKQSERQTRHAGSFLIMATAVNYRVSARYSVMPGLFDVLSGHDAGFHNGDFTCVGIAPGYAHQFVFGRFFIAFALFSGTGVMVQRYTTWFGERHKTSAFLKANGRLGIGYDARDWFCGFSLVADYISTRILITDSGLAVGNLTGYAETYAGYRFAIDYF